MPQAPDVPGTLLHHLQVDEGGSRKGSQPRGSLRENVLLALSGRRTWRKNFRFDGAHLAARYKEDRGSPGGEEVEAGDHLRGKGRQKRPVPAENPGENRGGGKIKRGVGGRNPAQAEQGHADNL